MPEPPPAVQEILDQIDSAERDVLRAPSKHADEVRMLVGAIALMGVEMAHSEEIEQAILRWLPQLRQKVVEAVEQTREVSEASEGQVELLHQRIKELEGALADQRTLIEALTPQEPSNGQLVSTQGRSKS